MQHERLLDLLAFLLDARRPVPANEIFEAFPKEYAGNVDARERKFSRDKEALRELGVPIEHVVGDEPEETGYRIDREQFYLPDIRLTPAERAALYAVGAAAQAGAFPLRTELAHALTKLDAGAKGRRETPVQPPILAEARRPELEQLLAEAVAERRRVTLVYPPETRERTVDPYAFSLRRGRFVLVGFCHLRGGIRTFAAERIARCAPTKRDARVPEFEVPADFDPAPHLPRHPWDVRVHAPVEVTLSFAPEQAESGPHALGIEPGRPVATTNVEGLLSQLLSLGGVRVEAPESVRDRLRARLEALRDAFERGEPLEERP